jgi:hypothetical protein
VTVKNSALPLSDASFFCAAAVCLLLLDRAEERSGGARWRLLGAALVAAAAAMALRKIGITLLPALVWAAAADPGVRVYVRRAAKSRGLVVMVLLATSIAAALVAIALSRTVYFGSALGKYSGRDAIATAAIVVDARTTEWGELVTNVPASRVPAPGAPMARIAGVAGLSLVVAGLVSRRHRARAADVFVATYMLLLSVWPFEDARFWLPLLPLLFGYGALAFAQVALRVPHARALAAAWLVVFTCAGAAAMGYSSWLTFSGQRFPERYGDGTLTRTYRIAYGLPDLGVGAVVEGALVVLERYDPRAAQ